MTSARAGGLDELHRWLLARLLPRIVCEPSLYDQEVYAPGIGIVLEQSLTGPTEIAKLVSVSG